jgi:dephospho-CoA kinase
MSSASSPLLVLGITGAIGSGKSTAAECFRLRGAELIELDQVGHRLLSDPEVRGQINELFPEVAKAEDLKDLRRQLGRIVFDNPNSLSALERIMHQRMCRDVRSRIDQLRASGSGGVLVLAGALLFEMGLDEACDQVLVIDAPEEIRVSRVKRSRDWEKEDLKKRQARQMSAEIKRQRADRIIDNSDGIELLNAALAAFWEEVACP